MAIFVQNTIRMRITFYFLSLLVLILGCKEQAPENYLKTGNWRGTLIVKEQKDLPFTFQLTEANGSYRIILQNADERIEVDEISINGDSIRIQMPIFEGYLSGTFDSLQITGNFFKESLDRILPFQAKFGEDQRFAQGERANFNVSGLWETTFYPPDKDPYKAKGIFIQKEERVTGTFRTSTGDYRYLEGLVSGDSLMLSTFDGAHAFLFTAGVTDSTLSGKFYSDNHSLETFEAHRNESFELPDEDTLTFLKEGYKRFEFAFPDGAGKIITADDPVFAQKVMVVQIMGTWCPNCLDESKFLASYVDKNTNPDLAVVALAFEYAKTQEGAFKGINRLRDRLGIDYPILLAQFGTSDKVKANEKLPMLNQVLSYPTTLFIDKQGEVRKITTGFNGPATGQKYDDYIEEFDSFVRTLLDE